MNEPDNRNEKAKLEWLAAADVYQKGAEIVKAFQAAEVLAADLREAHAKSDNVAEEMLLRGFRSDVEAIRNQLKRLANAYE